MKTTIAALTLVALALTAHQDPGEPASKEPDPALLTAAERVNSVWGATDRVACEAALEEVFLPSAELYLMTADFGGVMPREALYAMASQLGDVVPGERSWTTRSVEWSVGADLAVRKARETLRHGPGDVRRIMTTSVFVRRGEEWLLSHAHHSTEPG